MILLAKIAIACTHHMFFTCKIAGRITQRSNIKEVVKTGAGENNVHFRHLLGILKLAWYLKSRFVGTHRCCQQRHTALTALQAALFGAT